MASTEKKTLFQQFREEHSEIYFPDYTETISDHLSAYINWLETKVESQFSHANKVEVTDEELKRLILEEWEAEIKKKTQEKWFLNT